MGRVDPDASPAFGSRSWSLRAEVDRRGDGVLLATGSVNNGLAIYVLDGHLVYEHNNFGTRTVLRSPDPVPTGAVVLGVDQERVRRGPAATRLWVGDDRVAEGMIPELAVMISSIGMAIGANPSAVSDAYAAPFAFDGTIDRIVVDTTRAMRPDDEAAIELRAALGSQ